MFWLDENKLGHKLENIDEVNELLKHVELIIKSRPRVQPEVADRLSEVLYKVTCIDIAFEGKTGFPLRDCDAYRVNEIIGRLRKGGLEVPICDRLARLAGEASLKIDPQSKQMDELWYEVTPLGWIQLVEIRGQTEPFMLRAVRKELIGDQSLVPEQFLSRNALIDVSLDR